MQTETTQLWTVDKNNPDQQIINQAARIIKNGGLVAFPTETVYGLGANGLDGTAVAGIYQAKGRPSDNPLILHVADFNMVESLSSGLPQVARMLMDKFWPGPLTLVIPKAGHIPGQVTGGLNTVGVRMPSHPVALALIKAAGVPIAAPSANRSGKPSPTRAAHVQADLMGRVDAILDGGPTGVGLESTVLDVSGEIPIILRPGGVTYEQLAELLPKVTIDPSILGKELPKDKVPKSPGMKYIHYAPAAPVTLFEGDPAQVVEAIESQAKAKLAEGKKVGILAFEENVPSYPPEATVLTIGRKKAPATAAANLFARLRQFDQQKVDLILAEGLEPKGIGLAVMNRLRRAAGEIVQV